MCLCSQYANLTICAPHGAKGRKVISFEGYSDSAEEALYKNAIRILRKLASKHPTKLSAGLHKLVAPSYGDQPILPPSVAFPEVGLREGLGGFCYGDGPDLRVLEQLERPPRPAWSSAFLPPDHVDK